jgi:REP element-mobilizing transposase RayT
MARQWRIEYPGALYHILSRGNERRPIFKDTEDKIVFLELVEEMASRFNLDIYAYVLMNNHYHLLIKTNNDNLSKSMQWFGATYTRRFNVKHRRTGHLFQGRFKSFIIENDSYLLRLSCYIHRNPLRAKIVKRLPDYKWSSYLCYAYDKQNNDWLKTDFILNQLITDDKNKAYKEMVQRYSKEEGKIWENLQYGLVFGSQDYFSTIKAKYLSTKANSEIPQQMQIFKADIKPLEIIKKAETILNCDVEKMIDASRVTGTLRDKRDLIIFLLWNSGLFRNQVIGESFGIGYSSISQRVSIVKKRLRNGERALSLLYNDLIAKIKM